MNEMTLQSICSDHPYSISVTQTIAEALTAMDIHAISSIVIVDAESRPVGIFTEYDALRVVSESIDTKTSVERVMTPEPFCALQSVYLHDAYTLMEEKRIRHLIVVNEDERFVGVVSEGDFLRHMGLEHLSRFKIVAEAMNNSILVIGPDTALIEVAALMAERKCDYAVVLNGGTPCGIITERDIARWCSRQEAAEDIVVSRLARNEFQVVNKELPLQEAAALMQKHNVHQLIVVDSSGGLAGLLTRHDVLHAVHGAYFEFLLQVIGQKSTTIEQMVELKQQLSSEKERIEKSELKLRKLFEALPDGVLLLESVSMLPVEFNAAAHENLGYSAEEFSKLRVSDYEVIESEEETQKHMHRIIEEGHDSFETVHRKKNGDLIHVWVNVLLIEIAGRPYMLALYRDITGIKKSEHDHAQQSLFLHTLINTMPDLVWLKDMDGTYLACNRMFERLYNAEESEIVGKNDFDFVDPELARFFREQDKAAVEAGGSRSNEEYLKFGDGSYEGYFETIKTPMRDSDGNLLGVLGVARDISDRKKKDDELKRVQELAHIGNWEWDIVSDRFSGSDEAYRIFGMPVGVPLGLEEILALFVPEDAQRVKYQLLEVSKREQNMGSTYRILGQNGEIRWIKSYTEIRYGEAGNPIKAIGIIQDLTHQIEREEELKRKDADLSAAQALAHMGSWRLDARRNLLEWSDETYRIFGIEVGTPLTYESFLSMIHPDDTELVDRAWREAMKGAKYEIDHRIIVNGKIEWVREKAKLEIDAEGNLQTGVGTVQVITERKLYEETLETMANYDALTGLANRSYLIANLKQLIEKAARNETKIALFMFDLDRFKDINDSFGHNAGDELLKQVGMRFSQRLRDGDLIARLGGDEFAVVLENLVHPEDAGRIAEEMISALASPYKLTSGAEIHVGASAGIVLYPQHGTEADKLLQHADAALYKAKSEGRGNFYYYTDDLTGAARKRLQCENHLRHAIENEEFEVYYQPQVHIETGRIVGAEALVRWKHPERGNVSPVEFIPIAEETGLIREIGEWVLHETCRQGKIWLDKGHRLTFAVNLSAKQIRHQNIVKLVENALKKSGFPADRLELEITESALMQREEETVAMLHSLRALGIRLAIDDFGTGYSSLSYLKRFPIDVLKIDKSFVDDIPYEQDDMAIVTAIIAMGNALGFQILAEGTEHEEQIAFLKQKGCTMYQGYYKSPPVPAEAFEKLLQ